MPITPTYPGIYIEELPNSTHTIAPAPTSITVFVGYSHPFKTKVFNQPIQIFSFTDYEREFGGLFASDIFDSTLAYSVNLFFLNGGTNAYVVGLEPRYYDSSGTPQAVAPATLDLGNGIIFTALEPTDANHPISVTINNLRASDPGQPDVHDTGDITISYGSRAETYRKVTINPNPVNPNDKQNFIETRIGTSTNPVSSLVTVPANGTYSAPMASPTQENVAQLITSNAGNPPSGFTSVFNVGDFTSVFQRDSSLDKLPIFNLLVLPGIADNGIWSEALAFCERKLAFLIMDPPAQDAADSSNGLPIIEDAMNNSSVIPKSTNGAIYFPYLLSLDPLTNKTVELPPSGFVAGIYARTDTNRGVWKAPAGLETTILNTTGVVERGRMTDMRQGVLNLIAVNCLRTFPGAPPVVFGARTLQGATTNTTFQQWRYVPVRRMALFIEQTLYNNLGWVIFEPNDDPLWVAIRTSIENFMLSLFNQGAFQGSTPSKAFQVKCDSSTTTQADIDNGIVNIIVAFAPLKPAEFVVVKIAQLAGQTQS